MFSGFCAALASYGWRREPSETPAEFLTRVGEQGGIRSEHAAPVIAEINRLLYNPATEWDGRDLRHLRMQLRRLRFQIAFSTAR